MSPTEIPSLEAADLTPREREIVHLVLAQSSNLAISLALDCSVKTVEFHISNIYRKANVSTRIELVMKIMNAAKDGGGEKP